MTSFIQQLESWAEVRPVKTLRVASGASSMLESWAEVRPVKTLHIHQSNQLYFVLCFRYALGATLESVQCGSLSGTVHHVLVHD